MNYGKIEGVQNRISQVAIGSTGVSTDTLALTFELLDAFVKAGGNTIDTAHAYNGGKSERAVGEWMRARGNRERIVLIDKGAHPYWTEPRVNKGGITQDIAESLERIQSDYIDIYLLHRDDPTVPVGPIVDCLNEEREAGHIRAFGGSNWSVARIDEANAYAGAHGLTGFVASSPNLSLARVKEAMWNGCLSVGDADIEWYTARQFPLFSWSSQAGGFFTGRYTPENTSNADIARVYYGDENWERLRRAQAMGDGKGCSANNVALAYVLNQPFPCFPIIGPRTVEELTESLRATGIALTRHEIDWLTLKSNQL